MKCSKCGAEVKQGSSFCSACGKKLKSEHRSKDVSGKNKKYKKGLFFPLTSFLVGTGGLLYTFVYQKPFLTTIYNEMMGNTVSVDESSIYQPLTGAIDTRIFIVVGIVGVVLALLAVTGFIATLRSLWNRIAHKDED